MLAVSCLVAACGRTLEIGYFSFLKDGCWARTSVVALATDEFSPAFQGRMNESLMCFSSRSDD
jgi:hypothetical protein